MWCLSLWNRREHALRWSVYLFFPLRSPISWYLWHHVSPILWNEVFQFLWDKLHFTVCVSAPKMYYGFMLMCWTVQTRYAYSVNNFVKIVFWIFICTILLLLRLWVSLHKMFDIKMFSAQIKILHFSGCRWHRAALCWALMRSPPTASSVPVGSVYASVGCPPLCWWE